MQAVQAGDAEHFIVRRAPNLTSRTLWSLSKNISKGIAAPYQRFVEMQVLAIVAVMGYCSAGCKKFVGCGGRP